MTMKLKKQKLPEILAGNPDYCNCMETLLWDAEKREDVRVPKPRHHSCDYINRVNAKILEATVIAHRNTDQIQDEGLREAAFQSTYSRHMNVFRYAVLTEMEMEARLRAVVNNL